METPTNVVRLRHPEDIDDPLTEVLRSGARRLLAQAVEMEAEAFLSAMQDLRLPDGRARLVRHGHGPERAIQTGIGPVPFARARVRDRGASGSEDRVRFTSTLLPKWARRTHSLDALLPVLYLRGISTGAGNGPASASPRSGTTRTNAGFDDLHVKFHRDLRLFLDVICIGIDFCQKSICQHCHYRSNPTIINFYNKIVGYNKTIPIRICR